MLKRLLASLIFLALVPQAYAEEAPEFYVLAMSWSPAYCAERGRSADPTQCGVRQPFRFIVHGLWPQGSEGSLHFCEREDARLSQSLEDEMLDIMPSLALIQHQWRKHGVCSGKSAEDYFALTRRAFERVSVPSAFEEMMIPFRARPEAIERTFIEANPGLERDMIAVSCQRDTFREVRICMDADLNFVRCPEVDQAGCRGRNIGVLAPR